MNTQKHFAALTFGAITSTSIYLVSLLCLLFDRIYVSLLHVTLTCAIGVSVVHIAVTPSVYPSVRSSRSSYSSRASIHPFSTLSVLLVCVEVRAVHVALTDRLDGYVRCPR